jgi:exodeoxyribonuclease VII small subunit
LKPPRPPASLPPVEAKIKNAPSFEDALAKLEGIVESMESGDVPLAALLAKFEEGTALLKICEARLKDAELKIELLKKAKDGSASFAPLAVGRDA